MDANRFTKKSLEAIQTAQSMAMEYGNAELTCMHLCCALSEKDGIVYRILKRSAIDADGLFRAAKEEVERLPRMSGEGATQPYPTASLTRVLNESEKLASGMKDDYVSVEHLFLCLFDQSDERIKQLFSRFGLTKNVFLQGMKEVRGNQNVKSDNPRIRTRRSKIRHGFDETGERA